MLNHNACFLSREGRQRYPNGNERCSIFQKLSSSFTLYYTYLLATCDFRGFGVALTGWNMLKK